MPVELIKNRSAATGFANDAYTGPAESAPMGGGPASTLDTQFYQKLITADNTMTMAKMFSEPTVRQLETKYGLKIELAEGMPELVHDEIKLLDSVFSRLMKMRPFDFEKIQAVRLYPHETRQGAAMSKGGICGIWGPFGKKQTADEFDGYDISEDSKWLYQEADAESFLFHVIAHEIGHLVEPGERPYFYTDRWCERFAEDYRIYVTSEGRSVVKRDLGGKDVPFGDERLEYFRKHYPMNK